MVAIASLAACSSENKESDAPAITLLASGTAHYGKTYPEWASAWWKWWYELPQGAKCVSPESDPTGESCNLNQPADVIFLAGTQGGNAERTKCIIPRGKPIFFPIINFGSDNAGVPPDQQLPETEIASSVNGAVMQMVDVTLKLDGVVVDTTSLRVQATKFAYTLPSEPNQYSCHGAPGVTGPVSPAYQGGFYALLDPPSPGSHTIEFSGRQDRAGDPFRVSVVYKLSVE